MIPKGVLYTVFIAVCALLINLYKESYIDRGEVISHNCAFGSLVGRNAISRSGRKFYKFTSIPYAKPPVKELRFGPPKPYGKWKGVLDATKRSPDCAQVDGLVKTIFLSEDCLYLNIYTPKLSPDAKLPVIVYIFGGHFMYGTSNLYHPEYFMDDDVVFVTFNYRTNILGFLNTGDNIVKGNQGLKDQVIVLQWVQAAIADFGGDPKRVTIMGSSAGGASVSYHLVSNMSAGLFHNAISHSGTNLCHWAFMKNPRQRVERFAKILNCPTDKSDKLVQCLKEKPIDELINPHKEIWDILHHPDAIFAPSLEFVDEKTDLRETFLSESPSKLMKEGKFHRLPWINGVVGDEGCYKTAAIVNDPRKMNQLNQDWPKSFANLLSLENLEGADKAWNEYFPGESSKPKVLTREDLQNISNVISDRWFLSCSRASAVYYSKHAPVYSYFFNVKAGIGCGYIVETTLSIFPMPISTAIYYIRFLLYDYLGWKVDEYGVCHSDELQQLIPLIPDLLSISPTSSKYHFSQQMVRLWVSFARTSVPDPFLGTVWKANRGKGNLIYIRLDADPKMIEEPFTQRLKFWDVLGINPN